MEIWKEIKGYEDYYLISNKGNVMRDNRILKTKFNRYAEIHLCVDGKAKKHYIHRLVATAFIPNPHNKLTVNHKNGNKHDNGVSNLEWASYGENAKHAYSIGLKVCRDLSGVNNPNYRHGNRVR